MSALRITGHAAIRMAQRGIGKDDLELALLIGTDVNDGYLVREKDFQAFDRELKRLRDQARKLVGKRVVVDGNRIITTYHAYNGQIHRLLRSAG